MSKRSAERSQRRESGHAVIETLVVFPIAVFAMMLIIQFGLYYNSVQICRAAAEHAVEDMRIAPIDGGDEGAIQAYGQQSVDEALARFKPSVEGTPVGVANIQAIDADRKRVSITVTAQARSLVRVVTLPIKFTVEAEIDNFTTDRS